MARLQQASAIAPVRQSPPAHRSRLSAPSPEKCVFLPMLNLGSPANVKGKEGSLRRGLEHRMDGSRFDHLARRWATRRTMLGGLLAGLAGFVGGDVEAGKKRKRKHNGDHTDARKREQHAAVLAEKKKKKKKCKGGTVKCGKVCVNARTDALNCGGCGHRCSSGAACVGGVCQSPNPTCPSGQMRCGTQCVDPKSDEAHCGGCGQQCQGDLTCLDGVCGCADSGDTKCGNLCVDTQSDAGNCGSCGQACGSGQRCQGGQCIQVGGYPCNDVYDCGGNYRGVVCRNGQCACEDPEKGLCYDPRQGSYAICDVCCPGGSGSCPGDKVCNGPRSSTARCDCPVGKEQCAGSTNSHKCQVGHFGPQDNRRCGVGCEDCTDRGPTSFCCFGECLTACQPNVSCDLRTCGGCQTCGEGAACCRSGTSNLYGCTLLENGRCPGPPA